MALSGRDFWCAVVFACLFLAKRRELTVKAAGYQDSEGSSDEYPTMQWPQVPLGSQQQRRITCTQLSEDLQAMVEAVYVRQIGSAPCKSGCVQQR
jgi:hypothetical protein